MVAGTGSMSLVVYLQAGRFVILGKKMHFKLVLGTWTVTNSKWTLQIWSIPNNLNKYIVCALEVCGQNLLSRRSWLVSSWFIEFLFEFCSIDQASSFSYEIAVTPPPSSIPSLSSLSRAHHRLPKILRAGIPTRHRPQAYDRRFAKAVSNWKCWDYQPALLRCWGKERCWTNVLILWGCPAVYAYASSETEKASYKPRGHRSCHPLASFGL